MAHFSSASRTIIIRASRDTLGLVAAAATATFTLAYAVHSKHDLQAAATVSVAPEQVQPRQTLLQQAQQQPQQDWAGHLAELSPSSDPTTAEPMSSASLVVPKSQLALPALPPKPPVKPRACLDQPCLAKAASASAPSPRHAADLAKGEQGKDTRRNLLGMLNPLSHLPDMSGVGRPFAYAGNAVSGWIKRF